MKRWFACAAAALLLAACGGSGDEVQDVPSLTALSVIPVEATATAYDGGTLVLASVGAVTLWNASDLRQPRSVGRIEGTFTSGASTISDQFTALALGSQVLAVSRIAGCLGQCQPNEGRVELYEVSRPEQPRQLAVIERGVYQMRIDAGRLYLLGRGDLLSGSNAGTLTIVDIATPSAPVILSTTVVANAMSMDKRGDRLYLPFAEYAGSGSGMQVLDVSDPVAPRVVATVGTPYSQGGEAAVATDGSQVYWVNGGNRVRWLDLQSLAEAGEILLDAPVSGVASDGSRLYLTGPAGIAVFDSPATRFAFSTLVATPQPAASVSLFGELGVVVTEVVEVCTTTDPLTSSSCTRVASPQVVLFKAPG